MSVPNGVHALEQGEAFIDVSDRRKVGVSGADAIAWLDDLLSADLSDLGPNEARRALLLTPTGRIRADVTVAVAGGSVLLLQDPEQPDAIDRLLAPYVLSSDVRLDDRTAELCLFAFPGRTSPPSGAGTSSTMPSCLGPGVDLIALAEDRERLGVSMSKAFAAVTAAQVEAWRVAEGIPRFGVDALPEDLPQEAGLVDAVSFAKGCYLGQEAVAKVQNLGHPRRLVLHLRADGEVDAGEALFRDGNEAGVVTSAAPSAAGTGTVVLARVRWDVRAGPFTTPTGARLRPVEARRRPTI